MTRAAHRWTDAPPASGAVIRRLVLAAGLASAWFAAAPASAAELLMFETRGCPWCVRWRQEVGVAYPRTTEGQRAPVRSIDLNAGQQPGITLAKPVQFSPTFVLIDDAGKEVGRITGYPGADFFWGLFGEMARKLPPKPAG